MKRKTEYKARATGPLVQFITQRSRVASQAMCKSYKVLSAPHLFLYANWNLIPFHIILVKSLNWKWPGINFTKFRDVLFIENTFWHLLYFSLFICEDLLLENIYINTHIYIYIHTACLNWFSQKRLSLYQSVHWWRPACFRVEDVGFLWAREP